MMNSSEECSSGCESGWTLYLEHSFLHGKQHQIDDEEVEGTDIEDLSMVSDASSGPPLYSHDEETGSYFISGQDDNNHYPSSNQEGNLSTSTISGGGRSKKHQMKKKKVVEEQSSQERQIHPNQVMRPMGGCNFLDDTASSPAFNNTSIPQAMDYSPAFSATHFQQRGTGVYDEQFGYVQPSLSGNYLQNHQLSLSFISINYLLQLVNHLVGKITNRNCVYEPCQVVVNGGVIKRDDVKKRRRRRMDLQRDLPCFFSFLSGIFVLFFLIFFFLSSFLFSTC